MQKYRVCVIVTLLIFAAVGLIAAGACSDPTIYERAVVFSGHVVDADTKEPVDSAWITPGDTLNALSLEHTDSLGQFSFPSTPTADHVLHVGKDGYRTGTDTVHVRGHDLTDILIELKPGGN